MDVNLARINDSVLRVWGESVVVEGLEVTGVFTQPVIDEQLADGRKPAPKLTVRTADISCIEAGRKSQAIVRNYTYTIISVEPDDGGMTVLTLRKG